MVLVVVSTLWGAVPPFPLGMGGMLVPVQTGAVCGPLGPKIDGSGG